MRRAAGFVIGAAIAFAVTIPFASAAASTGEPEPSPSAVGVSVTIPGTPGATPTPTPSPSRSGGGGGGGGSTPAPTPSTPPACAKTDADGQPAAPDVPGAPSADATEASIDPDEASPGDSVKVSAVGFAAGEQVEAMIYSQGTAIGSETAGLDGAITMTVELPEDTSVGDHTLQLMGWVSCAVANGPIFVVSNPGSGESVFPWIAWVVVGSGVLLAVILAVLARLLGWLPFGRRGPGAGSVP